MAGLGDVVVNMSSKYTPDPAFGVSIARGLPQVGLVLYVVLVLLQTPKALKFKVLVFWKTRPTTDPNREINQFDSN